MSPVETVAAIYAAFARGDADTILGLLSPDVRWERWIDDRTQADLAPWLQERRGARDVTAFFKLLSEGLRKNVTVSRLEADGDDTVRVDIVLVWERPDGSHGEEQERHFWHVAEGGPEAGKVRLIRQYVPPSRYLAAPAT